MFAVDSEFFQIKEFFQPREEPFDTDPFCIFVREPFRVVWFDSGFCCFDNRCDMVFEEYLSDLTRIKCLISDEEPGGEPSIICFDLPVKVVELLGVMDVGRGDGKSDWKFCSRVDHHMEFIPVHIFFFDMVPAPCCLWVIQVSRDDRAVLDDGGDAEEFACDELLDDFVEQCFEGGDTDAVDEMTIVSDIGVTFESKLSPPEVIFF